MIGEIMLRYKIPEKLGKPACLAVMYGMGALYKILNAIRHLNKILKSHPHYLTNNVYRIVVFII
jgi:hypothetical protein